MNILIDTGPGNSRRLIGVLKLSYGLSQQQCTVLLAMHAFTRCDTTSAFKGIGKVKPIKVLDANKEFEEPFMQFGSTFTVAEQGVLKA